MSKKTIWILCLCMGLLGLVTDMRVEDAQGETKDSVSRSFLSEGNDSGSDDKALSRGAERAASMPPGDESTADLSKALTGQSAGANAKLAWALWRTAEKTSTLAKSVTENLGDYVKEKSAEKRRNDLMQNFYLNLEGAIRPLQLNREERLALVTGVEKIYIEDGESGKNKLDTLYFRDLPQIVKKEYADIVLARTQNGPVDTYDWQGHLKTRWNIKNGKPDGAVITHYDNGEILYIDNYENGRNVHRKKYNPEGKLEFEQAYQYEDKSTESPAGEDLGVPETKIVPKESIRNDIGVR
ncbi:MAG: hypothetical protein PHS88_00880 [Candidatus Omnitrophica bacterium]|nr:hypothetical protein [Candidatus Omnitrophota bacterium]